MSVKYTFASGGTELLKNTLFYVNGLDGRIKALKDKEAGKKKWII